MHSCSNRRAGTGPAGPASAGPIIANVLFFPAVNDYHISKSVSTAESAAKMSVPEKFHPSKSYVFPVRKFGSKAKGRN